MNKYFSWRKFFRSLERFFAILGVLLVIYFFSFNLSIIASHSMAPTLEGTNKSNGDWVLTEKLSYCFRAPKRWEIVSFYDQNGVHVMKRIVGLPKETVSIEAKEFWIYINDKALPRPKHLEFLKYYAFGRLLKKRKMKLKDNYCILGDLSRDSDDSRFNGPLEKKRIMGRAWLIVWPWHRIGFLR